MKKKTLIATYSLVIVCCLYYVYKRIDSSSEGEAVQFIQVSEIIESSLFATDKKSINVLTEYTSCAVCLAEIDEFYKLTKEIGSSIAFKIILLDANIEETTLFQKSIRKGIEIESVEAANIDMNWFNYGDTTYYAQLVFNNK